MRRPSKKGRTSVVLESYKRTQTDVAVSSFRSSPFPPSPSVPQHPTFFVLILFARIAKMRVTLSFFAVDPRDKVFSLTFTGGEIPEVSIEDGEIRRNVAQGTRPTNREKEVSVFLMLVKPPPARPFSDASASSYGHINIRIKNGLHTRRHRFGDYQRA